MPDDSTYASAGRTWATPHEVIVTPEYLNTLQESRDWWETEWEHKSREAERLWLACIVLAVLCGLAFFVGTVVG